MPDSAKNLENSDKGDKAVRRLAYWLERVLGLGLAMVLLRSSFAHWGNPYFYLDNIYGYRLLGMEAGVAAAFLLPFVQIILAGALIIRWPISEAYTMAGALFLLYAVAQAVALARGWRSPAAVLERRPHGASASPQ